VALFCSATLAWFYSALDTLPSVATNSVSFCGVSPLGCSRFCSCQSLREPHEATENNKAAATGSIQNTCNHQFSTAFNWLWNAVRDQIPYPILLP
jgi:hypothetical protein